jgi:hypothetical protein
MDERLAATPSSDPTDGQVEKSKKSKKSKKSTTVSGTGETSPIEQQGRPSSETTESTTATGGPLADASLSEQAKKGELADVAADSHFLRVPDSSVPGPNHPLFFPFFVLKPNQLSTTPTYIASITLRNQQHTLNLARYGNSTRRDRTG